MLGKQIQILHEVTPHSRRIAILLNESNRTGAALYRAAAQNACAALGLTAVWVVASAPAELEAAVKQIVRQRAHAVVVVADSMYNSERVKLQELLHATRLPVAYGQPEHVVAGGLLSYASNYGANFRYAAKFVDQVLKSAKPAEPPVEQPLAAALLQFFLQPDFDQRLVRNVSGVRGRLDAIQKMGRQPQGNGSR